MAYKVISVLPSSRLNESNKLVRGTTITFSDSHDNRHQLVVDGSPPDPAAIKKALDDYNAAIERIYSGT